MIRRKYPHRNIAEANLAIALMEQINRDERRGIPGAKEAQLLFGSFDGSAFESLDAVMKSGTPYVLNVLVPLRAFHILTK